VRQQLKALLEAAAAQQAENSASRQQSERGRAGASAHGLNPPPSQHLDRVEGGRAAMSAVKSWLRPNHDAWNTIEGRRRAGSVDNHRDNRSCHHEDQGCGRCHDSDDDCDRSWSLNQKGLRAFG
jgi:hypothetical protein